jgi:uncharacterized membrane protein
MPTNFFTKEDQQLIIQAIKEAEKQTSGEIRVHLEANCKGNVLDCAAYWFGKLNMHKTNQRNGVLIYLAYADKKFAIIGDAGINKVVLPDFWESTKDIMTNHFKTGDFVKGLCEGIKKSGEQLKKHFPYQSDDKNELSDELSFGK